MAYSPRLNRKRHPLSAEFMYLLVVLAAGVTTAYWAGHRLGLDLSIIETAASVIGLDETASSPSVGYVEPPAAYCNPGEQPAFSNGLATLKQQVGDPMGAPVECEHPVSASGNTSQQTTTGLAAYDKSSNTVSFTDGWRHWALTANGLVSWEGTDANPPPSGG
ncbi:MAG: hypothetical protein JOZ87_10365 [Chloroflexi bacterium]|nr:hypothetical protein [Chloroflexota bacterium]